MRHRGQNRDILQPGYDTPKIDPDPKARSADKWLERLYGVHDLLDAKCVSAKLERHVRVAILDSGVDLPLPVCQETYKRIIGFKDYIDTENKAHVDTDGHGTHTLALVMKAAPKADVYVARVFRGRGDNGAISKRNSKEVNTDIAERDSTKIHQGIAQAIRDAVDEWQVDIVSMSFGFERAIPEIGEAIRYAESKNVVLFAAANNKGGNEDVCFPARLSQVICIHATDGEGNPASFTASSEQGEDNFAVLGERVMSNWPLGLGQGHQVRKSGTSCATPIAAGIAAMVLYFARSYLALNPDKFPADRFHFEKLSTTDGMRKVFHRLAKPRGAGYNYVCRWEVFEYTLDSTFMDLILMDLKKI
ncbi:peptidase S8/S53 domain-containing protein [Leptodontidium sp. 2 PMI_412]|nr:peptidase S8/S53 domain-containing protein [Leptodontidium sp. 2 PMI_412]